MRYNLGLLVATTLSMIFFNHFRIKIFLNRHTAASTTYIFGCNHKPYHSLQTPYTLVIRVIPTIKVFLRTSTKPVVSLRSLQILLIFSTFINGALVHFSNTRGKVATTRTATVEGTSWSVTPLRTGHHSM